MKSPSLMREFLNVLDFAHACELARTQQVV